MTHPRWTLAYAALATVILSAAPARAEHMTLVGPEARGGPAITSDADAAGERKSRLTPSDLVDVDIKIGAGGFRLGARVFGESGVWGAWVNGQSRPDGFTLDGRVQQPERAYNFKINADIDAWAKRALDLPRP
jgi:hypothetical protein